MTTMTMTKLRAWWQVLLGRLYAPIDGASLAVFRVLFGLIMLWEVYRYFDHGWIARYWIDPVTHFTYPGFGWLAPWPGQGMYIHFVVLGLLAICITLGLFYRVTMPLFWVGFTYVFLLDQSTYLNHFYLVSLMSFVLMLLPANRLLSLDSLLWPQRRSDSIPAWALGSLIALLGIVYVYAAIAKLTSVDWLMGQPARMWLAARADYPLIGPLLAHPWTAFGLAYGGLLYDLLIVPVLLWRRTRLVGMLAAAFFHLSNVVLFSIGIFPWLMLATLILFLPPSWPRRVFRLEENPTLKPAPRQTLVVGVLLAFTLIQVVVPLRHWLYPGDVAWTEEGHRFSWRMKLRDKEANVRFFATDPTSGAMWEVDPSDHFTRFQLGRMPNRPDMVLQAAHHIGHVLEAEGYEGVEIRVLNEVSLNGRPPIPAIDPRVDLMTVERSLAPATWLTAPSTTRMLSSWSR